MTTATATPIHGARWHRVAGVTAVTTGAVLLVKVGLIIATGNRLPELLETALFAIAALLPLVTAVALAAGRRGWPRRLATGLGVVVAHLGYITMLSDGVGAAVELITDVIYLADELPLALLGAAWLFAGLRMRSGRALHSR